jgi:hypothetical protein
MNDGNVTKKENWKNEEACTKQEGSNGEVWDLYIAYACLSITVYLFVEQHLMKFDCTGAEYFEFDSLNIEVFNIEVFFFLY